MHKKDFLFIFLAFIPLLLTSYLLFLKDPPVWPDESVFVDIATTLINSGKMGISLHEGINPDVQKVAFGYPPVYFLTLGTWISIFGSNIESVRILSLILAIISLVIFYAILELLFQSTITSFLGTSMLSLNVYFSRAARIGRMEILVVLFSLLSVFFFFLSQKNQHRIFYIVLSSCFAGLAFLTHPVGIISPLILGSFMILSKDHSPSKTKQILAAILPFLTLLVLWLTFLGKNISSLLATYQLHWQSKSLANPWPYIFSLYTSDISWFILLTFSIAIFLMFVFTFKFFNHKGISLLSALIISVFVTLLGKENSYWVIVQPFLVICASALLYFCLKKGSKTLKITVFSLLLLFVLANINIQFFNNDNFALFSSKKSIFDTRGYNYHQFTKLISNALLSQQAIYHKGKLVRVFIATVPDPYFDLKKLDQFTFLEPIAPSFPISDKEYKAILDSTDFIVANWFQHDFLADYATRNSIHKTTVSLPDGYWTMIITLTPRNKRI